MCCSGAYYLASSASKIISFSPTNEIGSIGVLIAYLSWKKFDERIGIKEIVITSSNAPNKYPDPETESGAKVIQDRVDAIERIFYKRISEGRGVSIKDIAEKFGRGGVLVSYDPDSDRPDAVTVGMIDEVLGINISENTKSKTMTTEENSMPTLAELMESDSGVRAEVEARDQSTEDRARTSERDKHTTLISKVAPYLTSEYPEKIKTLAVKVLKGESKLEVLEGAVLFYDAEAEEKKTRSAVEETAGTEETSSTQVPKESENGEVNNDADLNAVIEADKRRRGLK
jgi:ClpP class serine protease